MTPQPRQNQKVNVLISTNAPSNEESHGFTSFVPGEPIPQGSKSPFVTGGRALMVDANKKLKPWRKEMIRALALTHKGTMEGALAASLTFLLTRRKSVKRPHPCVKPDLDKLTRAVFDALTQSGRIKDDGQIVSVKATKRYAQTHESPGVIIRVSPVTELEMEETN